MQQLHDLWQDIIVNGVQRGDRTGTGTRSVFGRQLRFNLQEGFPIPTTRFVPIRLVIEELLWFLKGDTNNNSLTDKNVHIWDAWMTEDGSLGPIYGEQWRSWKTDAFVSMGELQRNTVDQIAELIHGLKTKPFSRRHIVSAWNPEDLPDETMSPQENVLAGRMALAPCHCLFQFYVEPMGAQDRLKAAKKEGKVSIHAGKGLTEETLTTLLDDLGYPTYKLSCQLYQRSADTLLGSTFNIPSYALLTMMVAQVTGMIAGDFVYTLGDAHCYNNQIDIYVNEQAGNKPLELPTMVINPKVTDLLDFKVEDFQLVGYQHHGKINYPVAV